MKHNQHATTGQPALSLVSGGLAGFIGTIPMTAFMLLTQRFLPRGQRYDLPPEIIINDIAHRTHIRWHMNKAEILGATLVSHLGYGAAMGMLYLPLSKKTSLSPFLKGGVFGLLVWASSYLGLLPLLGLTPTGQREPERRNLMMIAAHLVWGMVMAWIVDMLTDGVS